MKANDNIAKDLLMLIGYGSIRSKVYAVRVLFYLFPHLVPTGEESYAPAQNDFSSRKPFALPCQCINIPMSNFRVLNNSLLQATRSTP